DGLCHYPLDLRAGLFRGLLRGLVGHPGAAYAADGGDQRDQLGDHRRRADRGGGGRGAGSQVARAARGGAGERQHLRRLRGDRADAGDVQEEGEEVMFFSLAASAVATPVISYDETSWYDGAADLSLAADA